MNYDILAKSLKRKTYVFRIDHFVDFTNTPVTRQALSKTHSQTNYSMGKVS